MPLSIAASHKPRPRANLRARLLFLRNWLLLIAAFIVMCGAVIIGYGMLLERVVSISEMAR